MALLQDEDDENPVLKDHFNFSIFKLKLQLIFLICLMLMRAWKIISVGNKVYDPLTTHDGYWYTENGPYII